MHTLFDYLTHTKAIGYIVAFGLLLAYVPYWKFLTEREDSQSPLELRSRNRRS